jgi:hypothetical protein
MPWVTKSLDDVLLEIQEDIAAGRSKDAQRKLAALFLIVSGWKGLILLRWFTGPLDELAQ